MNKFVLIFLCLIFFGIGWISSSSHYGVSTGNYKSETVSHIDTKGHKDFFTMKLHTELELNRDNSYDLLVLTQNKSGSFNKGVYEYDGHVISFYEREHDSFLSDGVTLPFWERVVVSPGTMARENMRAIPYGANGAFILFSDRAAALYTSMR